MNCKYCSTPIPDDGKFCSNCGAEQPIPQEPKYTAIDNLDTANSYYNQAEYSVNANYADNYYPVNNNAINYNAIYESMTEDQLPARFKPMGAWSYFGHTLLFSLPLAGFIILLVFALGGTKNINKRNFARSYFCIYAIAAVVIVLIIAITAAFASNPRAL